jgi:hypothetical protein
MFCERYKYVVYFRKIKWNVSWFDGYQQQDEAILCGRANSLIDMDNCGRKPCPGSRCRQRWHMHVLFSYLERLHFEALLNLTVFGLRVKTHILADEATAMHLCCPLLGSIALEPLTYTCSPSLMLFNVIALVEDCLLRRLCEDVNIKPSRQPSLCFYCLVNFF